MTEPCRCLVPFCTHWTRRFAARVEWICGQHWRLVPAWLKARRRKAQRLAAKIKERIDAKALTQGGYTDGQLRQYEASYQLADRLWDRCKTVAIERAAGITA